MRLIDAIQAASIENLDQYSELAAGLGDVQTVREIFAAGEKGRTMTGRRAGEED